MMPKKDNKPADDRVQQPGRSKYKKSGLVLPHIKMPHVDMFKPRTVDDHKTPEWTTNIEPRGRPQLQSVDDHNVYSGLPQPESVDDQRAEQWTTTHKIVDDKTTTPNTTHTDDGREVDDKTTTKKSVVVHRMRDWSKVERSRHSVKLGLRPNAETVKKAKIFCAEQGITLSDFFEFAVAKLTRVDDHEPRSVDDKTTSDDRRLMMRWDTDERIINLYVAYNSVFKPKTVWRPSDDRVGVQYNGLDIRIVEAGIMETQVNKLNSDPACRINSFKFYTQQIEHYRRYEGNPGLLDQIITINRQSWCKITRRKVDLTFLNPSD